MAAYITKGMLGGMIGPTVAPTEQIAALKSTSYPSLTMEGIMMEPIAAVSATADPEMPPMTMLVPQLTTAKPPVMWPTATSREK